MKGEGAIVFLIVFGVVLFITLSSPGLPPGLQIYEALGLPDSTYPVFGVPAPTLGSAIFNGILYGLIVWIGFTILRRGPKKEQQIVTLLKCPMCGMTFESQDEIDEHAKTHEPAEEK